MASLFSTILSLVSNIQLPFNTHFILFITYLLLFSINSYFTSSIPFNPTDDDKYLPSDDPNITNLIVLNNFNYNKTFTLVEDHYFQDQLERFQTPLIVYQFN